MKIRKQGHPNNRKGKSNIEYYGKKRAKEISNKISNSCKGRTKGISYELRYGKNKSKQIKRKIKQNHVDISGNKNPMFGKHFSNESKMKMSIAKKGKYNGKNNPMYKISIKQRLINKYGKKDGLIKYKETIVKKNKTIRLKTIKRIEENKNNGYQIQPGYNSNACQIIENYGKEHGYNFQHAMNSGEYYIKDLGYWIDGYDKEKNTVIEYYEKYHKKREKKDKQRIQEIKEFLNCKIIIIRQWTNKIEII
jgi:hypothetical protein